MHAVFVTARRSLFKQLRILSNTKIDIARLEDASVGCFILLICLFCSYYLGIPGQIFFIKMSCTLDKHVDHCSLGQPIFFWKNALNFTLEFGPKRKCIPILPLWINGYLTIYRVGKSSYKWLHFQLLVRFSGIFPEKSRVAYCSMFMCAPIFQTWL